MGPSALVHPLSLSVCDVRSIRTLRAPNIRGIPQVENSPGWADTYVLPEGREHLAHAQLEAWQYGLEGQRLGSP
jgi:hypothetical protein